MDVKCCFLLFEKSAETVIFLKTRLLTMMLSEKLKCKRAFLYSIENNEIAMDDRLNFP